jgi:hypothetical protein
MAHLLLWGLAHDYNSYKSEHGTGFHPLWVGVAHGEL